MTKTATKPPPNDLYETDFYAWTQAQAKLLREKRWGDLDLDNLAEEVESVGRSDKREIRSRLVVVMIHLLKWKFQPGRRGPSWVETLGEQRDELRSVLEDSPSLKNYPSKMRAKFYLSARVRASNETGIAFDLFPKECPFTIDEILDVRFYPEEPGHIGAGKRK